MSTNADEWIGVAEVAAELHLTERGAWEIIRRTGLKMLNHHLMSKARFRRSDWEAAREAIMRPAEPRAAYTRPVVQAADRPKAKKADGPTIADKIAKLRRR